MENVLKWAYKLLFFSPLLTCLQSGLACHKVVSLKMEQVWGNSSPKSPRLPNDSADWIGQICMPLCTYLQFIVERNLTIYKYWLVLRATLKNYAPQLCNVTLGRCPEVV